MKYCIHCGQELDSDAVFCTKCGKKQISENKDVKQENEGLALGICSIVFCWFPILPFVFSIIAIVKGSKHNVLGTLICGYIGLILSIGFLAFHIFMIVAVLSGMFPMLIEYLKSLGETYLPNMQNYLSSF